MNRIRSIVLAAALVVCMVVAAQKSISNEVYWIDGDISTAQTASSAVDISSLATGLHSLTVRVQDSEGQWSSPVTRYFIIPQTETSATGIAAREYSIDGKVATRTALGASPTQIGLQELSAGLHSLTVRVKDDVGQWSSPVTRYFIIPQTETSSTGIAAREYWIDGKVATRTALGASPAQIDLQELSAGLHSLTVRVKDDVGQWSSPVTRYFIIPQTETSSTGIAAREYWIDGKVSTRTALGASPAQIDLQELSAGLHSLTVCVKDDVGQWSSPVTKYFIVTSQEEDVTISRYMYWIDEDTENLASGTLTEASGVLPVTISQLSEGEHTLSWSVADSKGAWSEIRTETFNFTKTAITAEMITLAQDTYVYAAEDIEPEIIVKDGTTTLVKGEDYDVTYADNHNAGEATLTVTGKGAYKEAAEVHFTIGKAAGTVGYEETSVSKTYGDASFTNPLTLTGDGTVAYSTSDATVATVDESSGEVTIIGSGEVTITATVTEADGGNYAYAVTTAAYTIGVNTAPMQVVATNYTGTYDGEAHGITVTVNVPEDATVKYGVEEGSYNLTESPTYSDAGNYVVYYEVTKPNYTTVTNSAVVTISKAAGTVSYEVTDVSKLDTDSPFTNPLTLTGDGTVTYTSDNLDVATVDAESGEVTITGIGEATITASVASGTNYEYATATAHYTLTVTEDPASGISVVTANDDGAVWYDLDGRRLAGKPTSKGVYVRNGRKVLVR